MRQVAVNNRIIETSLDQWQVAYLFFWNHITNSADSILLERLQYLKSDAPIFDESHALIFKAGFMAGKSL